MHTKPVYSKGVHKTSLQYRCTQNQFTVQVYINPVYSIQGGNKLVKYCIAQLWPHFESSWLFKSTGGSLDMIHLIISASQVLGWILEVNKVLEAKETFLSKYKYFWGFSHFEGGRHLLPYFSRLFLHKIIMFLCLLERKFPEFFKTHPTFSSGALQKAKKSNYPKFTLLWGAPCSSLKRAQKNCWGIYYQMDHI